MTRGGGINFYDKPERRIQLKESFPQINRIKLQMIE